MNAWQKFSVIIAFLTFVRLLTIDILGYISKRKKRTNKKRKKKKRQVSAKTKRQG